MPRKIQIMGKPRDGEPPEGEAGHYIKCPACGRWVDMRDLGDVLEHEGACDGTPAPWPN